MTTERIVWVDIKSGVVDLRERRKERHRAIPWCKTHRAFLRYEDNVGLWCEATTGYEPHPGCVADVVWEVLDDVDLMVVEAQ